jgi:hypothetical protein
MSEFSFSFGDFAEVIETIDAAAEDAGADTKAGASQSAEQPVQVAGDSVSIANVTSPKHAMNGAAVLQQQSAVPQQQTPDASDAALQPTKPAAAKPVSWASLVKKDVPIAQSAAAAAAAKHAPAAQQSARPLSPLPQLALQTEQEWLAAVLAALGPVAAVTAATTATTAGAAAAAATAVPALTCRGMVNTGNTCYRLSVLQALLACSPLSTALSSAEVRSLLLAPMPQEQQQQQRKQQVPTWTALAAFWREFSAARSSTATTVRHKVAY